MIGENHGTIEMDLLGPANAALERLRIRRQRVFVEPRLPLQPAKIEPAVRQVGLSLDQLFVRGNRFGNPAGAAQRRRALQQ